MMDKLQFVVGTAGALLVFALLVSGCLCALAPRLRELMESFRRLPAPAKALLSAFALVTIIYGGSKPVDDYGADDAYDLTGVYVEYDSTNDVTAVEVRFHGSNIGTATPVSVRNSPSEDWSELAKINATVTTDFTENILSFAVTGNVARVAYWWVGSDLPAVIVETTGIVITHYEATSHAVYFEWTCDDPDATVFQIQRKHPVDDEWQTVSITPDTRYVHFGFTVGESWQWRIMSTYEEGGDEDGDEEGE